MLRPLLEVWSSRATGFSPMQYAARGNFDGTQLVLPFDPNEVIDNLRLERYPYGRFDRYERWLKVSTTVYARL